MTPAFSTCFLKRLRAISMVSFSLTLIPGRETPLPSGQRQSYCPRSASLLADWQAGASFPLNADPLREVRES